MRMYLTLGCPAAIPNTRKIKIWVNVSLNQEFFPPLDCYVRARKAKSRHIRTQKIYIPQFLHYQFSSVQLLSSVQLFATPWTAACQASLSITTPGVYPDSCPLSRWCHPTISSSVIPFSSHLQSFPASESFQMSQFFASGGQSIGISASVSVLPMNIQDWFPLGLSGWISLQSKGLSIVFSNTTVQKHRFFGTQLYSPTLTSIHDHWTKQSFD